MSLADRLNASALAVPAASGAFITLMPIMGSSSSSSSLLALPVLPLHVHEGLGFGTFTVGLALLRRPQPVCFIFFASPRVQSREFGRGTAPRARRARRFFFVQPTPTLPHCGSQRELMGLRLAELASGFGRTNGCRIE